MHIVLNVSFRLHSSLKIDGQRSQRQSLPSSLVGCVMISADVAHHLAVHNKLKPKIGTIPDSVKYFSGEDLGDVWVDYRRSIH